MRISRRSFIKLGALGLGAGMLPSDRISPWLQEAPDLIDQWKKQYTNGTWLGRVLDTQPLRSRPDADSNQVGTKYQDAVVVILREVVGRGPRANPVNHRWFETSEGYLWAPHVFPMEFRINQPLETIPDGQVWVEVTVPWVQGRTQPSEYAPSAQLYGGVPATLYHSSLYPATKAVADTQGRIWYFLDELALPMYARAEGLRAITADEVAPISPEVEDKRIVVDLTTRLHTLSARENGKEVFFAYISSGKIDTEKHTSATPPGIHPIWRKRIGNRMLGGNAATGYDTPGVGWTCIFGANGEAVHSTHWHNDFGIEKSHGCVNARPQDAKWVFRWTAPVVDYPEGDKTISGSGSTSVQVLF
jgi:lipoprotein-anchoring transpeptidase ErfK/SrfK